MRSPDSDNCDRGLDADSVMRKLGDVPRDKGHDATSHLDHQSQTALRWRKEETVDPDLTFGAKRQSRVVAQHYPHATVGTCPKNISFLESKPQAGWQRFVSSLYGGRPFGHFDKTYRRRSVRDRSEQGE